MQHKHQLLASSFSSSLHTKLMWSVAYVKKEEKARTHARARTHTRSDSVVGEDEAAALRVTPKLHCFCNQRPPSARQKRDMERLYSA